MHGDDIDRCAADFVREAKTVERAPYVRPLAHRDQTLVAEQEFFTAEAERRRVAERRRRLEVDERLHEIDGVDIGGRRYASLAEAPIIAELGE